MRFFSTLAAGAALVASVFAVEINESPSNAEVGKTYTIKYSPGGDIPTTFILRKGPSDDLGTITTLTTEATGGTFEWTVDESLPNGSDYALEIRQSGATNYIGPFAVTGSSATATSSSSSASSTASSSGSSSSSASETSSSSTTLTTSVSNSTTTTTSPTLSSTGNGTASITASRTPTGTATGTTAQGAPQNTGAAAVLGSSPLALIFGVVGAMAYLN